MGKAAGRWVKDSTITWDGEKGSPSLPRGNSVFRIPLQEKFIHMAVGCLVQVTGKERGGWAPGSESMLREDTVGLPRARSVLHTFRNLSSQTIVGTDFIFTSTAKECKFQRNYMCCFIISQSWDSIFGLTYSKTFPCSSLYQVAAHRCKKY